LGRKGNEHATGVGQKVTSGETVRVSLREECMGRVKLTLSLEMALTLIVMKLFYDQSV